MDKEAPKKTETKKTVQKKTTTKKKTAPKSGSSKKLSGAKKKNKARRIHISIRVGLVLLALFFAVLAVVKLVKPSLLTKNYFELESEEADTSKPDIDVELLTVNPYSRPGTRTGKIKGIVMHYTANPGASAMANRDYFEGLKITILQSPAAISSSAWMGKSCSVFLPGRLHMLLMNATLTQYRLSAAIRTRAANFSKRLTSLW